MFVLKNNIECYHLKLGSSNKLYSNGGLFNKRWPLFKKENQDYFYFSMNFISIRIKKNV